jgi:hypothetical protein
MVQQSLSRLEYLCSNIPAKLIALTEDEFSKKPAPEKWSKKEILGHLIDSATNNHHRFVRAQFEDKPLIKYYADDWVNASQYQLMPTRHMVYFWQMYNLHIALLIKQMPEAMMEKECNDGDPVPHTLAWLFDDYVVHLEHHLRQIVEYT